MFGTIIIDAYKKTEKDEIANALEDLCSPLDKYGWASAGIYCFWDYNTHQTLYIGLASDLAVRFKQHNNILPLKSGSKHKRIDEYFENNKKLGYSIFVQSPLSQPIVHRNASTYEEFPYQGIISEFISEEGKDAIKRVEGILIESYRRKHGNYPPWNEIGGSVEGQQSVMPNNYNIVRAFSHPELIEVNPIISRSSLRELSNNSTYTCFESYLHGVRQLMLLFGMDYSIALNICRKYENGRFDFYDRIVKSGYLNKKLSV